VAIYNEKYMDDIPMLISNLRRRPPASDQDIAESERMLRATLPPDYIEFLKIANGGEGVIGETEYVALWDVNELRHLNQMYEIEKNVPGLLVFGSDGGGEAYGFDTRTRPWPVVRAPFVVMSWDDAEPMGATFHDFLMRLHGTE